jgi:hypothetical protein
VATKQRLGLRQVRSLKTGSVTWDPTLPGFGARRQRGTAISYVLFYRTREGRQRWFTIGRHGALGRRKARGRKRSGFWEALQIMPTLLRIKERRAMLKRFPNYATCTLLTPKPAAW